MEVQQGTIHIQHDGVYLIPINHRSIYTKNVFIRNVLSILCRTSQKF
jgi:hypothetical protein